MNRNIRLNLAIAIIFFMLGYAYSYFFEFHPKQRDYEDMFFLQLTAELRTLDKINSGQQLALVKRIEASLPSFVKIIQEQFTHHPGAHYYLWRIKMYYVKHSLEAPSEIRKVLLKIPLDEPLKYSLFYPGPIIDGTGGEK